MSKVTKSNNLKKRLLKYMVENLGNVTASCQQAKCSRKTYYEYYKKFKKFREEINSISEMALDFVEDKLFSLIEEQNVASVIFYLKTKGRKRGYSEKQEEIGETKDIEMTYDNKPAADHITAFKKKKGLL